MKFRSRILWAVTGVFAGIVLVVFLLSSRLDERNVVDNDYIDSDDSLPAVFESTRNADEKYAVKPNQQIAQLVNRFTLNWRSDQNNEDLWRMAASWISPRQSYVNEPSKLGPILVAMAVHPITKADVGYRGTQLKLMLEIDGHQRVVFKPRWYERDYVVEGEPYRGHDRHNAEIVAFHLSRLFELRRVPLTVGRVVDLETDILPVATERLRNTFFTNGSNTCFYGKCLYCKNQESGVCANRTKLEGAMILWMPTEYQFQRFRHPWARTYKAGKQARWETDAENYCADVQQQPLYSTGPLLMDIIDTCIFDYIIGNADRHHYEVFLNDTSSMLIMFDNGKSFGNPWHDEHSILAPLFQCKRVRAATVQRLRELAGGVLSSVLQQVLTNEPIAPLLWEPHFKAMDRRLASVLRYVDNFIRTMSVENVLIVDGYS